MSTFGRPLHFTRMFILAAAAVAASWVHPGHADAPPGRYIISNGTVLDTKTMLTWEQKAPALKLLWPNAEDHCAKLSLDGGGWRLPSMKELQTIVDRDAVSPKVDLVAFPGTASDAFWTSSSWAKTPSSEAWVIKFSDGYTTVSSKTIGAFTRCVR